MGGILVGDLPMLDHYSDQVSEHQRVKELGNIWVGHKSCFFRSSIQLVAQNAILTFAIDAERDFDP